MKGNPLPDEERAYTVEITAEARVTTNGGYEAAMDVTMELLPPESPEFMITSVSVKRVNGDELYA